MSAAKSGIPHEFTRGHALIVGVGEYPAAAPYVPNVPQVVADANAIAAALVEAGAYPRQQVELLTGAAVTLQALISALTSLAARASADSTVFLFLSSHGDYGEDGKYYIVTSDTQLLPSNPSSKQIQAGTGLSAAELLNLVLDIQAQRLICIINTCFSGEINTVIEDTLSADERSPAIKDVLSASEVYIGLPLESRLTNELVKGEGRVLLTSSRADESSRFEVRQTYTYFGQALIDGLYGRGVPNAEGYIGLYELYSYLYRATRAATAEQQAPVLTVIGGVGVIPVALHPRRGEDPSSGPLQAAPPVEMAVNVLPSSLDGVLADDRAGLLADMLATWIEGVLHRGLYTISPLRPTLLDVPGALPQSPLMTFERYHRPPEPLQPDDDIVKVFERSGGRLLIRGEPGGGKTTLMLELARELIAYAVREPVARIPVVLLLRWWADKKLPFADWIVERLYVVYGVPPDRAEAWIRNNQLVLLLDALDDVPPDARDSCVEALNMFLDTHGSTRIVLCCQTDAYERLHVRPNVRGGSILIQPLDPAQVKDYLTNEQLRGVSAALEQNDELLQLARLPLMLNMMAIAYQGQRDLPAPTGGSTEAWSRQLFDGYIDHQIRQALGPQPYTPEETKRWLAWLAFCLASSQEVDFYILRLEQLQSVADAATQKMRSFDASSPQQGWLPTELARRIFRGIAGMCFGLAFASVLILIWSNLLGWVGAGLIVIATALFFGLVSALLPERYVAIGVVRTPSTHEAFGPSLQRGTGMGAVVLIGLFTLIGAVGGMPLLGFALGCGLALIAGMYYVIAISLGRVLVNRLVSTSMPPMRRLLVFVLSIFAGGILSGLICGPLVGFAIGTLAGDPQLGTTSGVVLGLVIGTIFGLVQGIDIGGQSLINHYLLRWLLARGGDAPWDLHGFLHHAAGLTLLYRVGDGYMFIHRRMMEHLAQEHHL